MNNCRAILNKRSVNDTFNDTNYFIGRSREVKSTFIRRSLLNSAIVNKRAVKKHKSIIVK